MAFHFHQPFVREGRRAMFSNCWSLSWIKFLLPCSLSSLLRHNPPLLEPPGAFATAGKGGAQISLSGRAAEAEREKNPGVRTFHQWHCSASPTQAVLSATAGQCKQSKKLWAAPATAATFPCWEWSISKHRWKQLVSESAFEEEQAKKSLQIQKYWEPKLTDGTLGLSS